MKALDLSDRLTRELRTLSRQDIGFLVALAAVSLASGTASIIVHVSMGKDSIDYLISQPETSGRYHTDLNGALLFQFSFVAGAAVSWAGVLFRNAVGFLISLLSQVAMLTIYWWWDSWSTVKRGGPPLFSHQGAYGSNIFTSAMILPLSVLFIFELVLLGMVLWSARRPLQSSGS